MYTASALSLGLQLPSDWARSYQFGTISYFPYIAEHTPFVCIELRMTAYRGTAMSFAVCFEVCVHANTSGKAVDRCVWQAGVARSRPRPHLSCDWMS